MAEETPELAAKAHLQHNDIPYCKFEGTFLELMTSTLCGLS
jgi:hypothetical protein